MTGVQTCALPILPQHMICGLELTDFIRAIYPNIENGQALTNQYFLEHVIICPRNVEVDEINSLMCGLFPGGSRTIAVQTLYKVLKMMLNIL